VVNKIKIVTELGLQICIFARLINIIQQIKANFHIHKNKRRCRYNTASILTLIYFLCTVISRKLMVAQQVNEFKEQKAHKSVFLSR
jgi:hypothetical protein